MIGIRNNQNKCMCVCKSKFNNQLLYYVYKARQLPSEIKLFFIFNSVNSCIYYSTKR